jgi:hypothetical protein
MPGGPTTSIPYSAAAATSGAGSGGSLGGGGMVNSCAGSESPFMKPSIPAGSATSRKRASSDVTSNVCGMPRGP